MKQKNIRSKCGTKVYCIGLGVVSSIGGNCQEFISNLAAGNCGISGIEGESVKFGGFVLHKTVEHKYVRIADQAVQEALDDAGLKPNQRMGLVLGTSLAKMSVLEEVIKNSVHNQILYSSRRHIMGTMDYLAIHIQRKFRITGPSYVISNTCVSGISALEIGCHLIKSGQLDYCLVGSIELISVLIYEGLKALNALSTSGKLRPFGAERDGIVLGEGVGFLVLGRKSKKRSYGQIAGYATTNDGTHLTAPDREGRGLIKAIDRSLEMAEIKPPDLDCIFCGGTGTDYNDAMQAIAIRYLQSQSRKEVPVTSIKPLIGHTLAASGCIESIAALLMMQNGWLTPLFPDYPVDPKMQAIPFLKKRYYGEISKVLLIASGFTGVNGALVLGRDRH